MAGVPTVASGDSVERRGDRRGRPRHRLLRPRRGRQRQRRRHRQRLCRTAAPATAMVRIDRNAPAASFVNAQDPEDPELIEVRVSDPLSGPDPSKGRIEVRRAAPARTSKRCRPRPAGGEAAGPLGLRRLPGRRVRVPGDRVRRGGQLRYHRPAHQRHQHGAAQPAEGADRSARRVRRQDAGLAPLRAPGRAAPLPPRERSRPSAGARRPGSSPTGAAPCSAAA